MSVSKILSWFFAYTIMLLVTSLHVYAEGFPFSTLDQDVQKLPACSLHHNGPCNYLLKQCSLQNLDGCNANRLTWNKQFDKALGIYLKNYKLRYGLKMLKAEDVALDLLGGSSPAPVIFDKNYYFDGCLAHSPCASGAMIVLSFQGAIKGLAIFLGDIDVDRILEHGKAATTIVKSFIFINKNSDELMKKNLNQWLVKKLNDYKKMNAYSFEQNLIRLQKPEMVYVD